VPVHVQRAPERRADGTRVDVDPKWVGAECGSDADCDFTGGFCETNPYDPRGFCSAPCTEYCADQAGYPTTFCVDDPAGGSGGICVPQAIAQDYACRPYEQLTVHAATPRHGDPTTTADVCLPGSPGWVGDRCLADTDCTSGTSCVDHICTMACTEYCPDQPGFPETFCAVLPALGAGGQCVRRCTPSSNASECPGGMTCETASRPDSTTSTTVCVPQ
jgi:hypothetical protein